MRIWRGLVLDLVPWKCFTFPVRPFLTSPLGRYPDGCSPSYTARGPFHFTGALRTRLSPFSGLREFSQRAPLGVASGFSLRNAQSTFSAYCLISHRPLIPQFPPNCHWRIFRPGSLGLFMDPHPFRTDDFLSLFCSKSILAFFHKGLVSFFAVPSLPQCSPLGVVNVFFFWCTPY